MGALSSAHPAALTMSHPKATDPNQTSNKAKDWVVYTTISAHLLVAAAERIYAVANCAVCTIMQSC